MRTAPSLINFYLLLLAALVAFGPACQSNKNQEADPAKQVSSLRLHLEVPADGLGQSMPVPVYRANPMMVNVQMDPFLHEANIAEATVREERGTFAIHIQFDGIGTSLLNATTLANPGRRVAVACQFPGMRWLAAPVIQGRLANGGFTFTPDATREEAERIVRGINNAIRIAKKQSLVY